MRIHTTVFPDGRKIKQRIRGICQFDILNPCWDNRKSDIPGKHWSGLCDACPACTKAALEYQEKKNAVAKETTK
jgi:hypothetical protein